MSVKADGKPGGPRNAVQYNDRGGFGGADALTYDKATDATVLAGQANHTPTLSAELLANGQLDTGMSGWTSPDGGWTWESVDIGFGPFGAMAHDPAFSQHVQSDPLAVSADDYVLIEFFVFDWTQGWLYASLSQSGFDSNATPDAALFIVPSSATYTIVLLSEVDGACMTFSPQLDGDNMFDGKVAFISAKAINRSAPIVRALLDGGAAGGVAIHLTTATNLAYGASAARGMGPDADANLVFGRQALEAAWAARSNVGIGFRALQFAPKAEKNIAIGDAAMQYAQAAQNNTAVGAESLNNAVLAQLNVALGQRALNSLISGDGNVALGSSAGAYLTKGTGNIVIGNAAGTSLNEADDRLIIGSIFDGDMQAETLTIFADTTIGDDGSKGIILIDRDDSTPYRLYVQGGVLGIEAV